MQMQRDIEGRISKIEMTLAELLRTYREGIGHIMDTLKIPHGEDCHVARLRFGFSWRWDFVRNGHLYATRLAPCNLVVDEGLTYLLASGVSGTEYMFITEGAISPAAGDTLASHAGWTESTAYDEATRPAWSHNAAGSKQVTTATPSTFTCSASKTMSGGGLCTNNTKGGSTGTLISCVAFTGGNQAVADDDIIYASVTATAADDGV